jgi:hypothetical protein
LGVSPSLLWCPQQASASPLQAQASVGRAHWCRCSATMTLVTWRQLSGMPLPLGSHAPTAHGRR